MNIASLITLLHITYVNKIAGFNFALDSALIYQAPQSLRTGRTGAYFGFSVGLLPKRKNNTYWILVGSPKANSSFPKFSKIVEPGGLFYCDVHQQNKSCDEILIDQTENCAVDTVLLESFGEMSSHLLKSNINRDHAWLGGTIDVKDHPTEEHAVICSPRLSTLQEREVEKEFVYTKKIRGDCFVLSQDKKAKKLNLLTDIMKYTQSETKNGKERIWPHFSHGEAGTSVMYTPKGEVMFGAPGLSNWKGGCGKYDNGMWYASNSLEVEQISLFDTMGVSLSTVRLKKGRQHHYVIGGTRGFDTLGKVLVFTIDEQENNKMVIRKSLSGSQIGENYGSSLVGFDVNGDGSDDLAVGAPTHVYNKLQDVGCVYVHLNTNGDLDGNSVQLRGTKSRSARFGTSLMSPGDLNKDNCEDLIVGAPYESEGAGAVYVYLGSSRGIQSRYSQRITSESFLPHHRLQGLGISFSRPNDVDDNKFPDIAIGSFLSGHVVLLKSRPVIRVLKVSISVRPAKIDLDTASNARVEVTACLMYRGRHVPNTLNFTINLSADSERKHRRGFFGNSSVIERYLIGKFNNIRCHTEIMIVKQAKTHLPPPLTINLAYKVTPTTLENQHNNSKLLPSIDPSSKREAQTELTILSGCEGGTSRVCEADLGFSAEFTSFESTSKIVIGEDKIIPLKINVFNTKQHAYQPRLKIMVNEPYDLSMPYKTRCGRESTDEGTTVLCSLSNPLTKDMDSENIELDVVSKYINDSSPPLQVDIHTWSSSDEDERNLKDNRQVKTLQLQADVKIDVGWPSADQAVYYERISKDRINTSESLYVNNIVHIIKDGKTVLNQLDVIILIPTRDQLCRNIIYLKNVEVNIEQRQFSCKILGNDEEHRNYYSTSNNSSCSKPDQEQESRISCEDENDPTCTAYICNIVNWPSGAVLARIAIPQMLRLEYIEPLIDVTEGGQLITTVITHIPTNNNTEYMNEINTLNEFVTHLKPELIPSMIAWYWILLAVLVAGLVLLCIVLLCHKIGFFKRNKPPEYKAEYNAYHNSTSYFT